MVDRIGKAKIPVFQLRTVGVSTKGINIVKAVRVYTFLVQPRWEYAMHITPRRARVSAAIEELQKAFLCKYSEESDEIVHAGFGCCFG